MSDPALALQDGIETALRASAALKSAMGLAVVRLYTLSAPVGAPLPHIVIGDDQIIDDATECLDSSEVFTTIHVFARVDADVAASRRQAKSIAGVIRAVLQSTLTVTGFSLVQQDFETTRHTTDPDGLTSHSVVTHRFLIDPV